VKKIPKGMQEISDRKVMPGNPCEENSKRDASIIKSSLISIHPPNEFCQKGYIM
jgi:hypothetical protein